MMWINEQVVSNLEVVLKDAGLAGGRDAQHPGRDHEESNSTSTSANEDNGLLFAEKGEDIMDNVTSVPISKYSSGTITVVSSVGSFAPTLANVRDTNGNGRNDEMQTYASTTVLPFSDAAVALVASCSSHNGAATTCATPLKDQIVHTCQSLGDGMSSVGSFAPTLAEAKKNTKRNVMPNRSNSSKASSVASNSSHHSVFVEDGDGMSSVGSFAPTLAEAKKNAKRNVKTNRSDSSKGSSVASTSSHQTVLAEDCDGMSSVGSFAPTLAEAKKNAKRNLKTNMSSSSKGSSVASTSSHQTVFVEDTKSLISSMGSAPTLATKFSTKTLKNTCIQVQDPEDYDDGMSSVGMSRAPTLATRRSTPQSVTSPSVAFKDGCDVCMDSSNKTGGISTLGSRAPTLTGILKKTNSQQRLSKQTSLTKDMDESSSTDKTGLSVDHYASDMDLFGGVLGRDNLKSGLEDVVGTFLRRGAIVGVGIWIFCLIAMLMVAPTSSYQYMTGPEQMANATLLTLLVVVNLNRFGPYLINDRNYNFLKSGPMMASCVVQVIAIASVAAMLFLPTPVIIDPFMGVRCHLARWAEWTALAFVMTFLTESIDLPLEDADAKHAWIVGIMIAMSTVCGAIMPFCPNEACWWAVFATSCLLFSVLYVRLAWRGVRLWNMPKSVTSDREDYERAKYSFKLMAICAVLWTILASTWTACTLLYNSAEPGSIWANDWLILAVENSCEALSKLCYLSMLMEAHAHLFDEADITARRLRELRGYMSAVWAASTDVVIVCSSHDHMVNAAVSPAFFQMEHAFGTYTKSGNKRPAHDNHDGQRTLAMEVDPYVGSYRTYEMDFSKPMTRDEARKMISNSRNKARMVTPIFEKNLKVLSDLVCDACTMAVPEGGKHYTMRKKFYCLDMDRNQEPLCCEAKVVKLQDKAFLIVLRDMTEHAASVEISNVTTSDDDTRSHSTTDENESGDTSCHES